MLAVVKMSRYAYRMNKKLKKPSEYPQIYFRASEEQKEEIDKLVEQILKLQLEERAKDEKLPRRNKLMVEAILIGLEQIKRKMKK